MFGASFGALTANTGGALASRASKVVMAGYQGALIGNSVLSTWASCARASSGLTLIATSVAKDIMGILVEFTPCK